MKELRGDESREDFGARFGATRYTVANWEAGDTAPKAEQLRAIAEHYRVSADWLLGRHDDRSDPYGLAIGRYVIDTSLAEWVLGATKRELKRADCIYRDRAGRPTVFLGIHLGPACRSVSRAEADEIGGKIAERLREIW